MLLLFGLRLMDPVTVTAHIAGEPMADEQKREYVSGMYRGKGWKTKVKQMTDAQIVAIYLREIRKPKKEEPKPPEESTDDDSPF